MSKRKAGAGAKFFPGEFEPGTYVGQDGQTYKVTSDGKVYGQRMRTITVGPKGFRRRVEVPGTLVYVGRVRMKEKTDAVVAAGRVGEDQKGEDSQVQAPVDAHSQQTAGPGETGGSGDPGGERRD